MLVQTEELSKTYYLGKVGVPALRGINITVEKGDFLAITGPSGSGKTTLLNLIGCIDTPTSGRIFLEQEELTNKNAKELAFLRRRYFGFIFQTFNLIPVLTVYENVELPLRLLKEHSKKEIREMTLWALKEVGLEKFMEHKPLELSGGQRQRVAIARALVKRPKLVLADEPTANLDSRTGEAIVDLMREMNEREGVTFVFSTHDQLIMRHAKRVISLRDGQVVE